MNKYILFTVTLLALVGSPAFSQSPSPAEDSDRVSDAFRSIKDRNVDDVAGATFDTASGRIRLGIPAYAGLGYYQELFMGDIDPNRIYVKDTILPNGNGTLYSVVFYAFEDADAIRIHGPDGDSKNRLVEIRVRSEIDANKVAHALAFLAEHYAGKRVSPSPTTLSPSELLQVLLNKPKYGQFKVSFKVGLLTISETNGSWGSMAQSSAASKAVEVISSIRISDLDPERFKWTETGEEPSRLTLGCHLGQDLVEHEVRGDQVDPGMAGKTKVATIGLDTVNEHDAKRIAETIKRLCIESGWKPSEF